MQQRDQPVVLIGENSVDVRAPQFFLPVAGRIFHVALNAPRERLGGTGAIVEHDRKPVVSQLRQAVAPAGLHAKNAVRSRFAQERTDQRSGRGFGPRDDFRIDGGDGADECKRGRGEGDAVRGQRSDGPFAFLHVITRRSP